MQKENQLLFTNELRKSLSEFQKELEKKKGDDVLKTYLYARFAAHIGTNVSTLRKMLAGNFQNMQLRKLTVVLENLGLKYRFIK